MNDWIFRLLFLPAVMYFAGIRPGTVRPASDCESKGSKTIRMRGIFLSDILEKR